ncbi:hypothetical protein B0O80DRAFT_504669 [Mortierella sp. GBAus27b]|nr:hypothetical protein BGX31_002288 [Mortierella sp. GBA43]KAI8345062.1 hypothetical protein B0O80DRAFT_504669 [Mortierella sp. GBAus27b]
MSKPRYSPSKEIQKEIESYDPDDHVNSATEEECQPPQSVPGALMLPSPPNLDVQRVMSFAQDMLQKTEDAIETLRTETVRLNALILEATLGSYEKGEFPFRTPPRAPFRAASIPRNVVRRDALTLQYRKRTMELEEEINWLEHNRQDLSNRVESRKRFRLSRKTPSPWDPKPEPSRPNPATKTDRDTPVKLAATAMPTTGMVSQGEKAPRASPSSSGSGIQTRSGNKRQWDSEQQKPQ